ncbi:SAM-dependent methyltransferase [Methylobacterium gnaphalii]|uniref:SAM-dependent methyltransferase n=2 Tax=Methylobacterium gnaphalii TaxID=1010610 RepID=A0A512JIY0_9HYPH|nr:SAM-dependent methyltransferase [Methylobacterium gnaphalii]
MTLAHATSDRATMSDASPDVVCPPGEAGASLARVHETLQALLPIGDLAIYEAGGGAASFLPPDLLRRAHITVVDIDPTQIANNRYARTKICGDIQRHRLPPASIDLVTCYNVIEHLPDVPGALERFAEAVRPGGLLLIGAPHPFSLSGLVTKYSPHWFHVWFYRTVMGEKRAGTPGVGPFRVHYHPLVLPQRLAAYMARHGFETVYERVYESPRFPEMRTRRPTLGKIVDGITNLMNLALAHRTNVRKGDYHLLLRKRAATAFA